MKIFTFTCFILIASLSSIAIAAEYYQSKTNSVPCTREQMLEINNRARQDPQWIAGLIKAKYPDLGESKYTEYGSLDYYVYQAKQYFKNTQFPKYPMLELAEAYNVAASEHAHHMAHYAYMNHSGCCGNYNLKRMKRYSNVSGLSTSENLYKEFYHSWTCEDVIVDLIVDYRVPDFGHRDNIYNPKWTHVGLGFGSKTVKELTTYYVVFNYASGYQNTTKHFEENKYLTNYWLQNITCGPNKRFSGQDGEGNTGALCPISPEEAKAAAEKENTRAAAAEKAAEADHSNANSTRERTSNAYWKIKFCLDDIKRTEANLAPLQSKIAAFKGINTSAILEKTEATYDNVRDHYWSLILPAYTKNRTQVEFDTINNGVNRVAQTSSVFIEAQEALNKAKAAFDKANTTYYNMDPVGAEAAYLKAHKDHEDYRNLKYQVDRDLSELARLKPECNESGLEEAKAAYLKANQDWLVAHVKLQQAQALHNHTKNSPALTGVYCTPYVIDFINELNKIRNNPEANRDTVVGYLGGAAQSYIGNETNYTLITCSESLSKLAFEHTLELAQVEENGLAWDYLPPNVVGKWDTSGCTEYISNNQLRYLFYTDRSGTPLIFNNDYQTYGHAIVTADGSWYYFSGVIGKNEVVRTTN